MQFWHRLANGPIPMLISSGMLFSVTLLQLLGYQALGLALGFRFIGANFRYRLATRTRPVRVDGQRIGRD